jgi:hypothetical protein
VHAVDRWQQLAAEGVAGLVEGDDALLVGAQDALGLDAGDDPLDRRVEVADRDRLGSPSRGEDRGLVADVREVGPRQPARLLGHESQVDVLERLVAGVHLQDAETSFDIGGHDEHLAIEAARAQQRGVELVEQVGGGDHDDPAAAGEAVHLDEQLVERLVLLARDVSAAATADGVELVDEDDRRFVFAGDGEQAPDAGGAEAGEHLHEGGGRLGEELGARLVGDGLGEQRLAGSGRTVQEDALGHLRPERVEGLGFAQELDDLLQLRLGLVDARDVVEGHGLVGGRLDLLRLDTRHDLQRAPHQVDERDEEEDRDDGLPVERPVLDFARQRRAGRGRRDGVDHGRVRGDGGVRRGRVERRRVAAARRRGRRSGRRLTQETVPLECTILGIQMIMRVFPPPVEGRPEEPVFQ